MTLLSELSNFELMCLARSRKNVYYLGFIRRGNMKRFDDSEIYGIDFEPIVGGRMADWMRQLMLNQNEMMDMLVGPTEIHNQRVDSGLGPMTVKGELANTELIKPKPGKRVFQMWKKRTPFGVGILLSRYSLKLYLTFWLVGVGFIPEEVIWEREMRMSSLEQSSEGVQSAIT